MAKAAKKSADKKQAKREAPLQVNGSFMDIMKAAVKHRDKNIPAKKKP